jgi:phosphoribosyl 1,2-cyclic phosphodiesterase
MDVQQASQAVEAHPRRNTLPVVRSWGARGSIPSPGAHTADFGGNTSCVEIAIGDRSLIFDAGTGIRALGQKLLAGPPDTEIRAHIFLTHFHWDHIQGFPFFAPLYHPRTHLTILGPEQEGVDIQSLFAGQMGPIYFPVPFHQVAARTSFTHLPEGTWEEDGIRVTSLRMRHPSVTFGYRLEAQGRRICYIPDNELEGGSYPTGPEWRRQLLRFVAGADLLLHDAMFTEDEYLNRSGWGHSTYRQALNLATEGGVKRLAFFHHDPDRGDDELDRIVTHHRRELQEKGISLHLEAAREGSEIRLTEE